MESLIAARVSLLKLPILNILELGFSGFFFGGCSLLVFFFPQTKDNRLLCFCPSPDAYMGMI